jgi:uncharacterized protein (DUF362 family)
MSESHENRREHASPDDGLSRRGFLRRVGAAAGVAGLAAAGYIALHDPTGKAGLALPRPITLPNYFETIHDTFKPSEPRLVIARSGGDKAIAEMVRQALEPLGGLGRFIKKGDVVLLKPNVAFDRAPMLGATTNPDVVAAVAQLCLAVGAGKVLIADNPIEAPENCFYKSKITDAARMAGATVMLPSSSRFRDVQIRPGDPNPAQHEALGTWPIFYDPLRTANKVIGLPAIKDHNLGGASMCMKNWYGLLGGRRNQFHQAIHDVISDLGYMVSPTLVIADGTRVLMRNGPTGGRTDDVKQANTIVVGVDQVATDAWCYENLLERDPATLTYLQYAQDKFGPGKGQKRFGQRDWKDYKNRGLIQEINV